MLRKLTSDEIETLASRKNVRRIAVENFLMSMYDMKYEDSLANLEMDAVAYKWNNATISAIRAGIMMAA